MCTPYDDSPADEQPEPAREPWNPPFHPAPLTHQDGQKQSELLMSAAALYARVQDAAALCSLRAANEDVAEDLECDDPCAALDELTAEMREIDLCLQQMMLTIGDVVLPTTDADFTADLEVDFVPMSPEAEIDLVFVPNLSEAA